LIKRADEVIRFVDFIDLLYGKSLLEETGMIPEDLKPKAKLKRSLTNLIAVCHNILLPHFHS